MLILFIEMYLGCIYDACIQMLYKRDTKGDAYAKLLNVPMYIHFSEKKDIFLLEVTITQQSNPFTDKI